MNLQLFKNILLNNIFLSYCLVESLLQKKLLLVELLLDHCYLLPTDFLLLGHLRLSLHACHVLVHSELLLMMLLKSNWVLDLSILILVMIHLLLLRLNLQLVQWYLKLRDRPLNLWRNLLLLRQHGIFLGNFSVVVANEVLEHEIISFGSFEFFTRFRIYLSNRFKHVVFHILISILLECFSWQLLLFKMRSVDKAAEITSLAALWAMKILTGHCSEIWYLDDLITRSLPILNLLRI